MAHRESAGKGGKGKVRFIRKNGKVIPIRSKGPGGGDGKTKKSKGLKNLSNKAKRKKEKDLTIGTLSKKNRARFSKLIGLEPIELVRRKETIGERAKAGTSIGLGLGIILGSAQRLGTGKGGKLGLGIGLAAGAIRALRPQTKLAFKDRVKPKDRLPFKKRKRR